MPVGKLIFALLVSLGNELQQEQICEILIKSIQTLCETKNSRVQTELITLFANLIQHHGIGFLNFLHSGNMIYEGQEVRSLSINFEFFSYCSHSAQKKIENRGSNC